MAVPLGFGESFVITLEDGTVITLPWQDTFEDYEEMPQPAEFWVADCQDTDENDVVLHVGVNHSSGAGLTFRRVETGGTHWVLDSSSDPQDFPSTVVAWRSGDQTFAFRKFGRAFLPTALPPEDEDLSEEKGFKVSEGFKASEGFTAANGFTKANGF